MENLIINDVNVIGRIIKIDINKSPGPDEIYPRILYEVRNEVASILK